MNNRKTRLICTTGIFAAVILLFTGFFHIPSHTGYTHIGDGFIYLAACILPLPYAAAAGAAGAMLADCLTGFAIWAPGTVLIKSVTVLFFTAKHSKIITRRNILALIPSAALCSAGYCLYETLITKNFFASLSGIPGYMTQSVLSSLLFILLGTVLDRLKIKDLTEIGGNKK